MATLPKFYRFNNQREMLAKALELAKEPWADEHGHKFTIEVIPEKLKYSVPTAYTFIYALKDFEPGPGKCPCTICRPKYMVVRPLYSFQNEVNIKLEQARKYELQVKDRQEMERRGVEKTVNDLIYESALLKEIAEGES